jgi:hypothetical protein
MLQRLRRGDAEGDYRRHWLLMMALEDYFALRTRWYPGPKKALAWLAREMPHHHALCAAALRPAPATRTSPPGWRRSSTTPPSTEPVDLSPRGSAGPWPRVGRPAQAGDLLGRQARFHAGLPTPASRRRCPR